LVTHAYGCTSNAPTSFADPGFAEAEFWTVLVEPAWGPFIARVGAVTHGRLALAAHASTAVVDTGPKTAFPTGGQILDADAIVQEANLVEAMPPSFLVYARHFVLSSHAIGEANLVEANPRDFSEYARHFVLSSRAIAHGSASDTAATTITSDTAIASAAARARCLAAPHQAQRADT